MDFDINFPKKNYQLLEVKATLKLSKLRNQQHPLAIVNKKPNDKDNKSNQLIAQKEQGLKMKQLQKGFDPLSMMMMQSQTKSKKKQIDPLLEQSKESSNKPEQPPQNSMENKVNQERQKYQKLQEKVTQMKKVEFVQWNAVKDKAISGKLLPSRHHKSQKEDQNILMYMGEEEAGGGGDGGDKQTQQELEAPVRMGQGKSRLEVLDKRRQKYKTYNEKKMTMTLRQFKSQIKQLHKDMLRAWSGENRVQALKITIQCGKLLADPNPLQLYPLKFFAVVDILDSFGILVFDRLKKLSNLNPGEAVVPQLVPGAAKDICQNWFLKVSCIRELVPRLYLQISLANSRSFRKENAHKRELPRLARSIRGVGDPVIASYLAMFLTKIGQVVDPVQKDYLFVLIEVLMQHWKRASMIGHPKMSTERYISLIEPAVRWVFQALGFNSKSSDFSKALELVYQRDWGTPLFLKLLMKYFPPQIIDKHLGTLNTYYLGNDIKHPQHTLQNVRDIARNLSLIANHSKERVYFLNSSWKRLQANTDPLIYMDTCVPLTELVQKTMKPRQMNVFLQEVLKSFRTFISQHQNNEKLQEKLEILVMSVIMTSSNLSQLSTIEHLMPLLDYFKLDVKRRLCEMIMVFFARSEGKLTDPYYIHTLISFSKILHSAVTSAATTQPDQSYIKSFTSKMCEIIDKIDFGRDLERQLDIYTEARPLNIDPISVKLVEKVLKLSMKALQLVKGRHSKKTLSFVKACIAFSHITIPAISSITVQNRLYRLTAQVALLNTLISQADSLIKAIINNLQTKLQMERKNQYKTQIDVCDTICNLLGLLVVIPSNPQVSFFKIPSGILNLIKDHDWTIMGMFRKMKVLCALANYTVAQNQDVLPYHVTGVQSNDAIFIGDEEFYSQARQLMADIIDQMMGVCSIFKNDEKASEKYSIGEAYLDFANCLTDGLQMNNELAKFIEKLVMFADKQKATENYLSSSKKFIKDKIKSSSGGR